MKSTRLVRPLFTEVPVPSKENVRSCICVLGGINFAPSHDLSIRFRILFPECGICLLDLEYCSQSVVFVY
jgi:hypothetical protein